MYKLNMGLDWIKVSKPERLIHMGSARVGGPEVNCRNMNMKELKNQRAVAVNSRGLQIAWVHRKTLLPRLGTSVLSVIWKANHLCSKGQGCRRHNSLCSKY